MRAAKRFCAALAWNGTGLTADWIAYPESVFRQPGACARPAPREVSRTDPRRKLEKYANTGSFPFLYSGRRGVLRSENVDAARGGGSGAETESRFDVGPAGRAEGAPAGDHRARSVHPKVYAGSGAAWTNGFPANI